MSRAGTPTDNAAMESINGRIKSELFTDFHLQGENIEEEMAVPAYVSSPSLEVDFVLETVNILIRDPGHCCTATRDAITQATAI